MRHRPSINNILVNILYEVENINDFTKNLTLNKFRKDYKTYYACITAINLISESSKKLTDEYKNSHSDVSWSGFKQLRNKLTHNYYSVGKRQVWDLVKQTIPRIEKQAIDCLLVEYNQTCRELVNNKHLDPNKLPYLKTLYEQEIQFENQNKIRESIENNRETPIINESTNIGSNSTTINRNNNQEDIEK